MQFTVTDPINAWYMYFDILSLPLILFVVGSIVYVSRRMNNGGAILSKVLPLTLVASSLFVVAGLFLFNYTINCCGAMWTLSGFPLPFYTSDVVDFMNDGYNVSGPDKVNFFWLFANFALCFNILFWSQIFFRKLRK